MSAESGVIIKLQVKEYFKTVDVEISNTSTVHDVKSIVSLELAVPICYQDCYFRGHAISDSQILWVIGVENGNTITLTVKSEFHEMVHPFDIRDPLTGQLLRHPVACTDGWTYEKHALHEWQETHRGQFLVSPMTSLFMNTGELNESVQDKVGSYIHALDDSTPTDGFWCLNRLGRVHTTLGHIRDTVGSIPRRMRPRIVCLGNPHVGISSLMERLAFMPLFPKGAGSTTMLLEYRFHRGPNTNPVLRVINGSRYMLSDEEEDCRENGRDCVARRVVPLQGAGNEVADAMLAAIAQVSREHENSPSAACLDRYIVLDVTSPTVPDITLVEIPSPRLVDDEGRWKEMLAQDFDTFGKHSIYLHVTNASEYTLDGPYSLLADIGGGALLCQTVGVITHVDQADPTRLQQLVDMAVGETTVNPDERDHLFPCGTILVVNDDSSGSILEGYESVYHVATMERTFLREKGWLAADSPMRLVAGSDALINRLHLWYQLHMENTWLQHAICNIQRRMTHLCRCNRTLGLPAMVFPLPEVVVHDILETVATAIAESTREALPSMLRRFDSEIVGPLEMNLEYILSRSRTVPVLEVDEHIRNAYLDIHATLSHCMEKHMTFWLDVITWIVNHDQSDVKLGRLGEGLISALRNAVQERLEKMYAGMEAHFIAAYNVCDVTDKSRCIIRTDRSATYEMPMVNLSFNIDAGTMAHMMSEGRCVFAETMLNRDFIRDILGALPLVEECREKRFDIWNEQRLLNVATSELLQLAYDFESTGCLLCPGRMVSLYHVQSGTFLTVSNGQCVPQVFTDYSLNSDLKVLEGHDAARFVVEVCSDGDITLYHQETHLYLGVEGEAMTLYNIPSLEDDNFLHADLLPLLRFVAEFQYPPDKLNAPFYASRAISLLFAASNTYITVEGGVTIGTSADVSNAIFLVVENPE